VLVVADQELLAILMAVVLHMAVLVAGVLEV
jgi:hypothetical protein